MVYATPLDTRDELSSLRRTPLHMCIATCFSAAQPKVAGWRAPRSQARECRRDIDVTHANNDRPRPRLNPEPHRPSTPPPTHPAFLIVGRLPPIRGRGVRDAMEGAQHEKAFSWNEDGKHLGKPNSQRRQQVWQERPPEHDFIMPLHNEISSVSDMWAKTRFYGTQSTLTQTKDEVDQSRWLRTANQSPCPNIELLFCLHLRTSVAGRGERTGGRPTRATTLRFVSENVRAPRTWSQPDIRPEQPTAQKQQSSQCYTILGSMGFRYVFPCKSAIGSEVSRACLINCDPIAKKQRRIVPERHEGEGNWIPGPGGALGHAAQHPTTLQFVVSITSAWLLRELLDLEAPLRVRVSKDRVVGDKAEGIALGVRDREVSYNMSQDKKIVSCSPKRPYSHVTGICYEVEMRQAKVACAERIHVRRRRKQSSDKLRKRLHFTCETGGTLLRVEEVCLTWGDETTRDCSGGLLSVLMRAWVVRVGGRWRAFSGSRCLSLEDSRVFTSQDNVQTSPEQIVQCLFSQRRNCRYDGFVLFAVCRSDPTNQQHARKQFASWRMVTYSPVDNPARISQSETKPAPRASHSQSDNEYALRSPIRPCEKLPSQLPDIFNHLARAKQGCVERFNVQVEVSRVCTSSSLTLSDTNEKSLMSYNENEIVNKSAEQFGNIGASRSMANKSNMATTPLTLRVAIGAASPSPPSSPRLEAPGRTSRHGCWRSPPQRPPLPLGTRPCCSRGSACLVLELRGRAGLKVSENIWEALNSEVLRTHEGD
ncbi:hypothetical protein PR048_017485 [Dryococelus australis]|uniref:Uncharacterized protein n=1 Tax=Dryococelus australis TaxID=614101 RepID=A0ABQ9H9M8_9NEOP|nr:hypothetical protein PR048_017485 [Dryococelus australis]